jgi:hypothetical protein
VSLTPDLSFAVFGGLGNRVWRGALRVAQRKAQLQGEALGERGRGLPAEAEVGAFSVVVGGPSGQCNAGRWTTRRSKFPASVLTSRVTPTPMVMAPQITGCKNLFWAQDSFSGHSQNMTVATRATAERKTFGHLS